MARMQEVQLAMVAESARWGDSRTSSLTDGAGGGPSTGEAYVQADWITTQGNLLSGYFPLRTGIVQSQFNARGWNVSLAAPQFSQYGGTVNPGFNLTLSKPGGSPGAAVIYYTLDGSDPRDTSVPTTNLRSSAILYTGPIVVNAGVKVNARIFQDLAGTSVSEWSPIIETTFLLSTPFPLRITELHYNPLGLAGVGSTQDMEFIELTNTGNQTISLNGVQITEFDAVPYTFANGISLAAGARIVVPRTLSAFNFAYGSGFNVAAEFYDRNLSNGGERIVLKGPVGEILQDITWGDSGLWPNAADGNGKSLEIINPLGAAGDPANWRASFYQGGSPGTSGVAPAVAGDFDADADVDGNDFLAWQRGLGTPAAQGQCQPGRCGRRSRRGRRGPGAAQDQLRHHANDRRCGDARYVEFEHGLILVAGEVCCAGRR